ncbi:MAG: hypothetical protein LIP05_16495 [Tannerellaceae bacterium]|nr:hypothetical protein [Tannerellaceae bacterium]
MKKELNSLKEIKKENPFRVPDGYMEGLTYQIMSQLPEKSIKEAKQVSLLERVRPWLYMAGMFAGLGLFFNVIVGTGKSEKEYSTDPLLVKNEISAETLEALRAMENEEYLEYIEAQYTDYLLAEEWIDLD